MARKVVGALLCATGVNFDETMLDVAALVGVGK